MIEHKIFQEGHYKKADLDKFAKRNPGVRVVDVYEQQLGELFEITYPHLDLNTATETFNAFIKQKTGDTKGTWVYFPWTNTFLRTVNEEDYYRLKTNRNQYLITSKQQAVLKGYTAAVLGLSVGNGIAHSLAHSGSVGSLILADKDVFSATNMNRVRLSLSEIGQSKVDTLKQQIHESDPYISIKSFNAGIGRNEIKELLSVPSLVIFDEMDDFEIKVLIRIEAKKARVPVIMMTNLGDGVLVDIERYDQDSQLQPFNSKANSAVSAIMNGNAISEEDKRKFAIQLVGAEHIPTRAIESVREIGRSLVGRPQLYGTVAVSAGLAPYILRQIALGGELTSGRYFHHFADIFNQPRLDLEETPKRQQLLKSLSAKPPVNSKITRPPEVDKGRILNSKDTRERILGLLQYAVLAPSTHNTQPWLIEVSENACTIQPNLKRQLPVADKHRRDLYISLGAFVKNLEIAAAEFGVFDKTRLSDEGGEVVARVSFKNLMSAKNPADQTVLNSIRTRTNYRGPFAPFAIPDSFKNFIETKNSSNLKLKLIDNRDDIKNLGALTALGLKIAYKNPKFRREIASWINPNSSRRKKGIPGYSLRMPFVTSHTVPRAIRFIDMGEKLAGLNLKSFLSSSGVIIVSCGKEGPKEWVRIGKISQSIFLQLDAMGATSSIFVAAIEVGDLAHEVKKIAKIYGNQKPQFLFCLGKPLWPKVYSPREKVESKLIS